MMKAVKEWGSRDEAWPHRRVKMTALSLGLCPWRVHLGMVYVVGAEQLCEILDEADCHNDRGSHQTNQENCG